MTQRAAISLSGVAKKYRLFGSPQERIKEALHPFHKRYHREFWALKDLSFDVAVGETCGILGRNGSGKSTLLQIIAGVTQPTCGNVAVNGRISAVLELGAGFNPEFTGRENVFLQGQIGGLSRIEIEERVPEIEAYADIGEFFDQPVRTYSSGMFLRVAFAAAISVDPDILIVDEALAVGDAKFQHKCFQTFRKFHEQGKTLLLVSHDMGILLRLCDSGVLLEQGAPLFRGKIADATNRYQALLFGNGSARTAPDGRTEGADHQKSDYSPGAAEKRDLQINLPRRNGFLPMLRDGTDDRCPQRSSYNKGETRIGDGRVRILDYLVVVDGQTEPAVISYNAEVSIYLKIHFYQDVNDVSVGFALTTKDCVYVYGTNLFLQSSPLLSGRAGETLLARFDWRAALTGGDYFLNLGCNQITGSDDCYLDVRRSIAHLKFADTSWCTGFVAAEARLHELERFFA
jgi:lipopolysaccharide transport system ATP-binding protein